MIVYNITTKLSRAIVDEWLNWQMEEHIPETMATDLFDDYKIYKLLEHDDEEGPTYIIQYFISTEKKYKKYIEEFAPLLRRKAIEKWGDQLIAHRTIMQLVN
jgi:hypothetical protein